MQRGRSQVSLMDLINAGLIRPGQTLQYTRRQDTRAKVTPTGTILCQGVEYNSLSAAGKAVTQSAVNGWDAWRAEVRDLGWIKLSELRAMVKTSRDKVKEKVSTGGTRL